MRRVILTAFVVGMAAVSFAQADSIRKVSTPLLTTSRDHFMIQLGTLSWANQPDSIKTGGIPRTFNMYVMLDFPFKTNPHFSVAIGPGFATDHMFFERTNVTIKDNAASVRFQNLSDTTHFKKYKLSTAFAEAPIELRYVFNPAANANSVKLALGVKIGTLLSAWVKGKDQENRAGTVINSFTMKEKSKRFFNTSRLSLMGRVGWGHFSLFGSYALTPLFKEGQGPKVQPVSIGLTLSGL